MQKIVEIFIKICYNVEKVTGGSKMSKIFNKNITPYCLYCKHGKRCEGTEQIVCLKNGVSNLYSSCKHFKYNPLNREPKLRQEQNNFSKDDFIL